MEINIIDRPVKDEFIVVRLERNIPPLSAKLLYKEVQKTFKHDKVLIIASSEQIEKWDDNKLENFANELKSLKQEKWCDWCEQLPPYETNEAGAIDLFWENHGGVFGELIEEDGKIKILVTDNDRQHYHASIPINYCPICGRSLAFASTQKDKQEEN